MAFTTWAALRQQILDAITDGSILHKSYTTPGASASFRDFDEVRKFLDYIDSMIDEEAHGRIRVAKSNW